MQPGIVIPPDAKTLSISNDGIVSVTQPGQAQPQQIGQLTLATFINEAGLESVGGNLPRNPVIWRTERAESGHGRCRFTEAKVR